MCFTYPPSGYLGSATDVIMSVPLISCLQLTHDRPCFTLTPSPLDD